MCVFVCAFVSVCMWMIFPMWACAEGLAPHPFLPNPLPPQPPSSWRCLEVKRHLLRVAGIPYCSPSQRARACVCVWSCRLHAAVEPGGHADPEWQAWTQPAQQSANSLRGQSQLHISYPLISFIHSFIYFIYFITYNMYFIFFVLLGMFRLRCVWMKNVFGLA